MSQCAAVGTKSEKEDYYDDHDHDHDENKWWASFKSRTNVDDYDQPTDLDDHNYHNYGNDHDYGNCHAFGNSLVDGNYVDHGNDHDNVNYHD